MNTINKRAPGRREKVYYNKGRQLDLSAFEEAKKILDSYRPFKKDMLIEYLHLFNDKFHGLYAKHLRAIAELTKISMSEVYEVASFYAHFKIIDDDALPQSEVTIKVCDSITCFMNKSEDLYSQIKDSNFNAILNSLAIGLENYFLIKTKKKHENVDREISTGAEIQSQLLPDYCPIIYGVDLAAHCRPALQLGGDYYDFMCLKTNISEKRKEKARWALVIGDVMGKGIPAGLLMTMLRGMLRAEVLTGLPPDRILHDLNQLAINDLDQSHRFVTLFYSDYDPRTKKLRYANAAHNPPLLWKSSDQKIIRLDAKGFVLGLQKDAEYLCGEIKLNQNDLVLYYTDGVIDTSNSLGQRFDEERLIKILTKLCKHSYTSQEILY